MRNIFKKQDNSYKEFLQKEIKDHIAEGYALRKEKNRLADIISELRNKNDFLKNQVFDLTQIIENKNTLKGNVSNAVKKAKNELLCEIDINSVTLQVTLLTGIKKEIKIENIRTLFFCEADTDVVCENCKMTIEHNSPTLVINGDNYSSENIMIKI